MNQAGIWVEQTDMMDMVVINLQVALQNVDFILNMEEQKIKTF
jgi:hypothetical protein